MKHHRQPAWSLHTQQPTTHGPLAEYGIELALRLAGDYDTLGPLEYARATLGWPQDVWEQRTDELLDLADELNRLEGVLGEDAAYRFCIDEYRALLSKLASGPLIESFDDAISIVKYGTVVEPTGLRLVKP